MTLVFGDFATYMEDGTTPTSGTTPTEAQVTQFIADFTADATALHGSINDCAMRRAGKLFILNAKSMSYNEGSEGGSMRYIRTKILQDPIVLKCLGIAAGVSTSMSFNTRTS